MTAMNWTELMIALLGWFAVSVIVALILGRIFSRGQSKTGDGKESWLISVYSRFFIKENREAQSNQEQNARGLGASLRHSGPSTITR